ncbi:hypothetical protein GCM10020219_098910 [Nonomuraea dietziae]
MACGGASAARRSRVWSARQDRSPKWYEPLDIWQGHWADDVRGGPIDSGHFLPEEAPDETARHLLDFLA